MPISVWSVVAGWALTHSVQTLRYAHLYYRGTAEGGLAFPGDQPPDDLDFAYFSFTVGMCFQVSDVAVTRPELRRIVLLHSVISFVYNTGLLALTKHGFEDRTRLRSSWQGFTISDTGTLYKATPRSPRGTISFKTLSSTPTFPFQF